MVDLKSWRPYWGVQFLLASSYEGLEQKINEFIEEHENYFLRNIAYQDCSDYISAMISYQILPQPKEVPLE